MTSPDNTTSSSPLSFLPRIANSGSGRYNGASNDFGSTTSASYTGAPSVTSNGSSYDPMDNYPLFSRQQSQSQFPELLATTPPFTPRSGSSGFLSSLSQTGRSQAGGGLKDCLILKSTSGAVRNVGGHYDDEDGGLPNDFFSRPIESDEVLEEGYGRSIRFPMPLYASSSLPLPKQPHPTMQPQPQMATYGREPYTAPLAAYNTFQRTVGPPPIGRPPQPAEGPLYRQTMPQSQCFYPQQPSSDYAAFNSEVQYHQPLARSSYSSAFVVPTESAPAFPSQFLQPSIPFLSNSPLQSIESLEGKESPRGSSRTGSVRSRRLVHPAAGDALPNPELNTSQADSSSASGDEKEGAAGTSPVSGETSSPGSKFSNKMFGLFSLFKKRSSIENSGSMNAQDISSFVSSNNSSSCVSEANNTDYKPPLRSRISCARPEDIAN